MGAGVLLVIMGFLVHHHAVVIGITVLLVCLGGWMVIRAFGEWQRGKSTIWWLFFQLLGVVILGFGLWQILEMIGVQIRLP